MPDAILLTPAEVEAVRADGSCSFQERRLLATLAKAEAELTTAVMALEPFAAYARWEDEVKQPPACRDSVILAGGIYESDQVTVGDCRRARETFDRITAARKRLEGRTDA